jgi:hypothetical protein
MKSDFASTFPDASDANCGTTALAALIEDISLAGATEAMNLFIVETRARLLRMVASDGHPDQLRREVRSRKVTPARPVRPAWLALRRSLRRGLQAGGSPRADDANVLAAAVDAYMAEVSERWSDWNPPPPRHRP